MELDDNSKVKIIIAEDERIAALDLQQALEDNGYTVLAVESDGKSILNSLKKNKPDLLLMDIGLKGDLDGIQTAEIIKSGTDIPIVFITAYDDANTINRAKVVAPSGYIVKPFNHNSIITTIEMALYKHKMEAIIKERDERFRLVVQATSDIVWDYDFNTAKLWLSENFNLIFGEGSGDFFGDFNSLIEKIHPDEKERVIEGFNVIIKNRRQFWFDEFRFRRSDGTYAFVFDRAHIFYDSYSSPVRIIGTMMDVTQRKEAEISLQKSEERYKAFIQQITEGIYRIEFNEPISIFLPPDEQVQKISDLGYIAECNDIMTKMYGYKEAGEIIGKKISELVINDDDSNRSWGKKFIENNYRISDAETKEIDKNGNIKYFLNNYVGIVENNYLIRIWGTQRDETERRKIEEELITSEYKFRTLVEQAADGILIAESDGKFVLANSKICEMLGYSEKELLKLNVQDTYPPGQEKLAVQTIKDQQNGKLLNYERLMKRRDGSLFPVEINVRKVMNGKLQAFIRDITERKKAEDALRESEQKYRLLIDRSPNAIGIISNYKILFINKTGVKLLGAKLSEEILGKNILNFIYTDEKEKIKEKIRNVDQNYDTPITETRLIRLDGKEIIVEMVFISFSFIGKDAVQIIVRDITDRKLYEEQLKSSKQQLRDLAAKLELIREEERIHIAREIHDELGQLLTALKMDIALLGRRFVNKPDNPKFSEAKNDLKSINSLIDKSIQTVRKIASELRSEVLNDLGLNEAIEWHANEIKKRTGINYTFSSNVANEEFQPEKSKGLFRIYQETMTNIIRHSNASVVNINLTKNDGFFILKVKDNGKGITQEEIENRKSLGILGMKERALMLDGKVEISGIKGKETVVSVIIPI